MDNEKSNPLCLSLSLSRLMLINRRMGERNIINEFIFFNKTGLALRGRAKRNISREYSYRALLSPDYNSGGTLLKTLIL